MQKLFCGCQHTGLWPAPTHVCCSVRGVLSTCSRTAWAQGCKLISCSCAQQAIGRSWRMGQKREVTVGKFFVANTVEERIIEVVRARQAGGSSADETIHTQRRSQVRP